MYLAAHADSHPEKTAVIRPSTGERLTFAALEARSNRLAQLLYARGLRPSDHVALFLENHLACFEAMGACHRSGHYLTPINTHLSAGEAAYIADDCDAKALLGSAALDQTAEVGRLSSHCQVKLSIGGAIDGFESYEDLLAAQPAQPLADERPGSMMLYSSGTTGRPKGIRRPLSEGKPSAGDKSVSFMAGVFGLDSHSVYLSTAPMYHGAPAVFTAATLQAGGTVVMMDRFDAETALKLIQDERITHSMWVPTMFVRMLKLDPDIRARYDLSSHRCAIHAAAPCPIEVKRRMIDWWGPILEEYYGSTEGAGMSTISSADWLQHPGSVGRAYGKAFHICDEDGRELPPRSPGMIYGEANSAAPFSYHKAPEKTAAASHPDHPDWLTVGDVGYLDEQGYLYLTDRKAFMIISGGVNIYPQQIEDALALHPKVADVAVIGVPNADLGEEVKAVVQAAPGALPSEALAQEIMDFVRAKLGRQLTPRTVDFVDELPRLPTGKLSKKSLRDRYWAAVASPIGLTWTA